MQPWKQPVARDDAGWNEQRNRYVMVSDEWQHIIQKLLATVVEGQPYGASREYLAVMQGLEKLIHRNESIATLHQPSDTPYKQVLVWVVEIDCCDRTALEGPPACPADTATRDQTQSQQSTEVVSNPRATTHSPFTSDYVPANHNRSNQRTRL